MTAEYKVQGDVAIITLNNPPVNGLGYDTRLGITNGLEKANADPAVKAIVLTGADKAFSGGADIREFNSPKALTEPTLHTLIRTAEGLSKPVVAAIHSVCMGGGLELALGCAYRVAVPGAQIALPEVKLGLLPGAGGTQRLPRAIGKSKAMDMLLTARMIDAAEAERTGLVSRVFPAEKLMEEALAVASTIAEMPVSVAMAIKDSVNRAYETTLTEGVRYERRFFHAAFGTPAQKEGMSAFLEKRKANFEGM